MRSIRSIWKPVLLPLLLVSPSTLAHEFWIEPLDYQIHLTAPIRAHLKVGQHFKGDSFPYIPDNTQSFTLTAGDQTSVVAARIGDMPAASVIPRAEGLAILSHVTANFFLEYSEPGKFERFLEAEGLGWVKTEHLDAGLSMTGVKEAYQRFAKSLIQVADAPGEDRLLGLAFEWLLETNPYQPGREMLQARLFWQGRPVAGVQARLFSRHQGVVSEETMRTDAEGRIRFPAVAGSQMLLNAVQMTRPGSVLRAARGVSWKSHWASLTFAVP